MSGGADRRSIVLLFGSGVEAGRAAALASESSHLASLLASADGAIGVSVISLGLSREITGTSRHIMLDDSNRSLTDRILSALGAFALRTRFAGFPLGRLLNSLGPVDQGRVFWRAVRKNPEAAQLLRSADIAIATDLTSTKAAWLAVHRGWVENAYYDHRSASVAIRGHLPAPGFTESL